MLSPQMNFNICLSVERNVIERFSLTEGYRQAKVAASRLGSANAGR